MPLAAPRELSTYDDVLAASGGDDFVRWVLDPLAPVRAWALDTGVAFLRAAPSLRNSLTFRCEPRTATDALAVLLPSAPEAQWVTLPRGAAEAVVDLVDPQSGDDWEWMRTQTLPPVHPQAARVVDLDHQLDDEVRALLRVASPRASAGVGSRRVLTWHGVPDGAGGLLACGAHTEHVPGVPHLASIATHPDARGHGLGEAVTSSLTRAALLGGRPVVTLGMYSDNAVARRLYERLGFRCDHYWSSRRLLPLP